MNSTNDRQAMAENMDSMHTSKVIKCKEKLNDDCRLSYVGHQAIDEAIRQTELERGQSHE